MFLYTEIRPTLGVVSFLHSAYAESSL